MELVEIELEVEDVEVVVLTTVSENVATAIIQFWLVTVELIAAVCVPVADTILLSEAAEWNELVRLTRFE